MFLLVALYIFQLSLTTTYSYKLTVQDKLIFPHPVNDKFYLIFQSESNSKLDLLNFHGDRIKLSLINKSQKIVETCSIEMNYYEDENSFCSGTLMTVIDWTRYKDDKRIKLSVLLNESSTGFVFQGLHVNRFNEVEKMFNTTVAFVYPIAMIMTLISVDGKVGEITADMTGKISCKSFGSKNQMPPAIHGLENLKSEILGRTQTIKEIEIVIRANEKDHLKYLTCVAGHNKKSLLIKILHPPTQLTIQPEIIGTLRKWTPLQCTKSDGYPQVVGNWKIISAPPNATQFYRIFSENRTFLLTDLAPVLSKWIVQCFWSEGKRNLTSTVTFTVGSLQNYSQSSTNKMSGKLLNSFLNFTKTAMERIVKIEKNLLKLKTDAERGAEKQIKQLKVYKEPDNEIMAKLKDINMKFGQFEKKLEHIASILPNIGKYVWKITGLPARDSASIVFSDPFLSHLGGYKMRLALWLFPNQRFSLWFYLMKGEYDDMLIWPMPLSMTLTVISDRTYQILLSHTFTHETSKYHSHWGRPDFQTSVDGIENISQAEKKIADQEPIRIMCTVTKRK